MISIGLVITKDKIKIVQLKGTYEKLSLIKTHTLEKSDKSDKSDILGIKKFFRENNIKTKYLCLNIPRRQVLVNIIELPLIKRDLIAQALKYEIEEHIPYPMNEVYYDYQILGDEACLVNEKKTNILLVAVRKEIIDPYLQLLSQAGLKPKFVDVDSFGVINLCLELFSKEFKQNTVLLITGGNDYSEISLFKNGNLEFTKSLPSLVDDAVFLEEIKKIIDYFQTSTRGVTSTPEFKVDKIILAIPADNLAKKLKEELGIKTLSVNPFVSLTSKTGSNVREQAPNVTDNRLPITDYRPAELTSITCVLRGIKEGLLRIDLSPMKEIITKEIRKAIYTKIGISATIIFILLNGIFCLNMASKERELQVIRTVIDKNKPILNKIMSQRTQLLEFQEDWTLLCHDKVNEASLLDLLLELSNVLPSNVGIKNITFEGDKLKELRGRTLGSASSLLPILENSPYFEQVEFIGSIVKHTMANQEVEEFSLKADLSKKEKEEEKKNEKKKSGGN
ncbi:MAG: pilus assembly protein PilM [Nitrospirota bacterium]